MTDQINKEYLWPLVADIINKQPPRTRTGEACELLRGSLTTLEGSVELVKKYREYSDKYDVIALMEEIQPRFLKEEELVEAMFSDLSPFEPGNYTGMNIFHKLHTGVLLNNIDTVVIPVLDASMNDDMLSYVLMISYLPNEMAKSKALCQKLQKISERFPDTSLRIDADGLLAKFYSYCDDNPKPRLTRIAKSVEEPAILIN